MGGAVSGHDANRRSFRADDLALELELPRLEPRCTLVLVPGLCANSWFFRVDADSGPSPARWLREHGAAVVHYDPRGLGRNRGRGKGPIDFAVRVHDLAAVAAAAHALRPDLPLLLFGHSFGGTLIYAMLADAADAPVRAAVTVGSPARLVPRAPPWERLFSRDTEALTTALASDGWLDAVTFAYLQNRICTGSRHWRCLPRWVLAAGLWATARWRWLAQVNVTKPRTATFLYRTGLAPEDRDYTAAELQRLLRAGVLEREHRALLLQLLAFGRSGSIALRDRASLLAASARVAVPVLAAFSPADELVLADEVASWASPAATLLDVGACGHGGYFFKPGPRRVLFDALRTFLDEHAG